uniref:PUM-HD domain-containing protein n=1 Tax=Globodera rostochiensis TaxID=31243 RepID=A0A914I0K8_GLORO
MCPPKHSINVVIEHGLPEDRERIVRSLQGNILKYAQDKFASNVIKKCLVFGTLEQKNALIDEVCADNGSGSPPLLEMIKDPFGNKVVQKMLNVADSARRRKMIVALLEYLANGLSKKSFIAYRTAFKQKQRAAPNNERIHNGIPPLLMIE